MSEAAAQANFAAPLQVNRALAQKLETAHGWCVSQYAASLQRLRPQVGAAALRVADGVAIYAGPSPFSFAVGVGLYRPITSMEIDEIEAFFEARGVASRIDVTPFTDVSVTNLLDQRGYRIGELTTMLALDLKTELPPVIQEPGVLIRWAQNDEHERWARVLAECFFVNDPGAERRANIAALFHAPQSLNTVALVDGELAGVAGGMIPDDRQTAVLFGSSTLPKFRRRGIHAAMLRFRLERAQQEGCELALLSATPGSTSERNLLRHGFVECYQKITYTR